MLVYSKRNIRESLDLAKKVTPEIHDHYTAFELEELIKQYYSLGSECMQTNGIFVLFSKVPETDNTVAFCYVCPTNLVYLENAQQSEFSQYFPTHYEREMLEKQEIILS